MMSLESQFSTLSTTYHSVAEAPPGSAARGSSNMVYQVAKKVLTKRAPMPLRASPPAIHRHGLTVESTS